MVRARSRQRQQLGESGRGVALFVNRPGEFAAFLAQLLFLRKAGALQPGSAPGMRCQISDALEPLVKGAQSLDCVAERIATPIQHVRNPTARLGFIRKGNRAGHRKKWRNAQLAQGLMQFAAIGSELIPNP